MIIKQKNKTYTPIKQKISVTDTDKSSNFKLSFQYLDTTQKFASTFKDWQKNWTFKQSNGDAARILLFSITKKHRWQ